MRRYKALLVNPNIHDFAAYDFWLKPLGLLYVGALLKRLGAQVFLVDMMNRHDLDLPRFVKVPKDKYFGTGKFPSREIEKPEVLKEIPRRFKSYGAPPEYLEYKLREIGKVDAVFVTSMMTYWYSGVWEMVKALKELTSSPVLLGGVYTHILPRHALKSGADFIFPYTNLNALPRFLRDKLGWEIPDFEGNWFEDLDPAYELYNRVGYLVFLSSIGCPFRCSYCITPLVWKFSKRSPEKVIKAIERYLELHPVKDVAFFDDAFLVRKDHVEELLRGLRNFRGIRFHLPNGIHARLVDRQIAELLKEANFKTIKLGYETSGNLQRETGGKVFDEDLERAVEFLKEAGFTHEELAAYVLVNMPGQSYEDAERAVYFVHSLGIRVNVNEYTPIPGTKDWQKLVKEGLIDPDVDPLLLNNTILPLWWKVGMGASGVERIKKLARELNSKLPI